MKPVSVSENMMFCTVRLECSDGSSGTGFFFDFIFDKEKVPVIITNKHVVKNNTKEIMTFQLHLCADDNKEEASDSFFTVTYESEWVFHSKHDLCFTFVNPLFEEVHKRTGKTIFYKSISEDIILETKELEKLSALEQVVMVGYPNGLWDKIHNYPLFRRGYTAAHPAYDFNMDGVGVVDMACINGSSGSPIFILDEMGYIDKNQHSYKFESRLIFLGILYGGPQRVQIGDVVNVDVKMQMKTVSIGKTLINLGYYIKSYEINEFKNYIENIMKQQR